MSLSAPPLSPAARQRMIAERQRTSLTWRIIHLLGSLQLALILLATIAIACAVATFAESGFTTKVAQAYIYKAPWFLVWLGVLCVNLFAVTLTRWPWQKKHAGFIITHYGIIMLLVGAIVGLHTGFEGNVTLHKDKPPVTRVTTSRSIIQIESPSDTYLYIMGFDAETARLSEKSPRLFPVPGTPLKIVADAFSPNLIRENLLVPSEAVDAAPGILIQLSSQAQSQTLDFPMVLTGTQPAEEDFFGLARIVFRPSLPISQSLQGADTRMVFGKFSAVLEPNSKSSGVEVRLNEDGSKVTILSPEGTGATYLREEIMRKPITEAGAVVMVENYWPDFAMENGRPISKSPLPANPAILVRVTTQTEAVDAKPTMELAPGPDGTVSYRLLRSGAVTASGTIKSGDSFMTGWADWKATLVSALPKSAVATEIKPGPELASGEQGIPGFRAHLVGPEGQRGPDRWIESGQVTSLTDGRNVVRMGYGLETRPLPFSIRLVNFEVPRDEGTDTPSDFRASVEFKDSATGETKTGLARMNQPASFPGTLSANLTGINYKFSQAEWNPRDLGETTLQVLYDPGWLLKWTGSLAICVGIALMFYWKPKTATKP